MSIPATSLCPSPTDQVRRSYGGILRGSTFVRNTACSADALTEAERAAVLADIEADRTQRLEAIKRRKDEQRARSAQEQQAAQARAAEREAREKNARAEEDAARVQRAEDLRLWMQRKQKEARAQKQQLDDAVWQLLEKEEREKEERKKQERDRRKQCERRLRFAARRKMQEEQALACYEVVNEGGDRCDELELEAQHCPEFRPSRPPSAASSGPTLYQTAARRPRSACLGGRRRPGSAPGFSRRASRPQSAGEFGVRRMSSWTTGEPWSPDNVCTEAVTRGQGPAMAFVGDLHAMGQRARVPCYAKTVARAFGTYLSKPSF
mmetsp:Transcript_114813/g.324490  ORF Transcript_114813/g.324490 Transcript_114813/m.324490 type:complete len:322 (+) Transcript_114813:116-1081(+)